MRPNVAGRKRGLEGILERSRSEGYSSRGEGGGGSPGVHSRRPGVGGVDGEDEDGGGDGDDSEGARSVSAGAAVKVGESCVEGDGASKPSSVGVALRLTLAFPLALDVGRAAFRWDFCGRDEGAYL
jgi:hypothetical protein